MIGEQKASKLQKCKDASKSLKPHHYVIRVWFIEIYIDIELVQDVGFVSLSSNVL